MERIVIEFASDEKTKGPFEDVGYFQVTIEKDPARVVVDLQGITRTAMQEGKVACLFKSSKMVSGISLTSDPTEHSANLVFALKEPSSVEIFKLLNPGQPGRLVLDIKKMR